MPYRTSPQDVPADPHELREIAAMAAEARRRQRRASLAVGGVVTACLLGAVVVSSASTRPPRVVCHRVEVRWENAPDLPGNAWTTCETR